MISSDFIGALEMRCLTARWSAQNSSYAHAALSPTFAEFTTSHMDTNRGQNTSARGPRNGTQSIRWHVQDASGSAANAGRQVNILAGVESVPDPIRGDASSSILPQCTIKAFGTDVMRESNSLQNQNHLFRNFNTGLLPHFTARSFENPRAPREFDSFRRFRHRRRLNQLPISIY